MSSFNQPESTFNTRVFRLSVGGAMVLIVGWVLLVGTGRLDPFQPSVASDPLIDAPLTLFAEEEIALIWFDTELTVGQSAFLRATQTAGSPAFGLVVGSPGRYWQVGLRANGYIGLFLHQAEDTQAQLAWQTWPHLEGVQGQQEFYIERLTASRWRVWLNRELLWEGEQPATANQLGLWADNGRVTVTQFSHSP